MSFDKSLIKVTEYKVLGKLPDPFTFNDGSKVRTKEDWCKRREEIWGPTVELQYGKQPPAPEFLEVEPLYYGGNGKINSYRIITGTKEKPVNFIMMVMLPEEEGKWPAVVSGDLCFPYAFDIAYDKAFTDNNVALVLFNRCELAHDINTDPQPRKGQLYDTYPEYDFGALAAWAWGYSRCVDALEQLDIVDMSCIAFTGHSRGGKTAALAGVLDERAVIVNPNATCAGACGCYRLHVKAITEDGEELPSETLDDMTINFPFWLGPKMGEYRYREEELPFDAHYMKALIAPRVLFVSEAASDMWSNPVGSWVTTMAAKEVYKFLGAEENILWYFRKGYHYQKEEDCLQLVNIIRHFKYGEALNDKFFKLPFEEQELIFDWRCPT